jgi:lipopolysaccharide/colanic/teichoic acid biosynthesis glycosyltransferase/glycosyltransferase involved in cell wall biosynthesis
MPESVAIVHDWLTSMRGGERVVEALCKVFPHADLFTLTWDPSRLSPALAERRAKTSLIHCIASAPLVSGRFRALLPLFPLAVESFRLDRYALVVSSSHCVAIGAIAPPQALHVAYVHSTLRYVREAQPTYEASVPGGRVGRAVFRGTARYMRQWESTAAHRPHVLIANSTYTRERIRRYYQRDALVIEPPIETDRFERASANESSCNVEAPFLVVSALVPNKRVELALRAFKGRRERLLIVGEGPERARLEPLAGPNVTFVPRVDEAEMARLFASSRALLHPGVDDFGMVMVEALAAGKPVIACAEGGALDIVRDGETGIFISEPTVESVRAAVDRFMHLPNPFDPTVLKNFAKRFDRENFERRFTDAVEEARKQRRDTIPPPSGIRVANGAAHPNGLSAGGHGMNGESPLQSTTPAVRRLPLLRVPDFGTDLGAYAPPRAEIAPPLPSHAAPETVKAPTEQHLRGKRLVDVALATTGLVATAPLVVALGALVRLDSAGPALFYQRRTGLDQRPFTLVKLRTMDADRRVTRIGRWLRPLGLDELPQLWNVLKGDMSLVGPRPELPELVERYEGELPGYRARHGMRPGITGWAQVNGLRGNANLSIADRLRFDLQYLRDWSLALDARILLRTTSTVLGDTIRSLRE